MGVTFFGLRFPRTMPILIGIEVVTAGGRGGGGLKNLH